MTNSRPTGVFRQMSAVPLTQSTHIFNLSQFYVRNELEGGVMSAHSPLPEYRACPHCAEPILAEGSVM